MLKIINALNRINSHSVTRNTVALLVLQVITMIAPLIALPYLTRVLGVDGFGIVMLVFSACAIAMIITDFGFNLSATYKISKHRQDKLYINELVGAIFLIKIALICAVLFTLFVYSYYVGGTIAGKTLLIYIGINIVAQAFIPTWFFQGIEKMKNVTYFMVFSKLSYLFLVFTFIKVESDIDLVILFYALSNLVAACIAIRLIYINGYSIAYPKSLSVGAVFKDSFQFFISRAAVSIYTAASTFLVGAGAGIQQAAMYSASEKVYQASQSISGPISQALFPYMAQHKDNKLLFKIIAYIGLPLAIICCLIGFWAEDIMALIFGYDFKNAGDILQIFLFITVINFVSVNFGYPAFAGLDKVNVANYTVMLGALIQAICLLVLFFLDRVSAITVVSSVLISELFIMSSRVALYKYYCRLKN
ncbi:oligosaccharide flippase family protein [Shewanella sp. 10N.286.51.B8]|uniref:oligosaccharide flippase family protein n=1 Tax=Shewanella sp. 10N.286.51.B8 TaxID=3229708 RepID=UPI00354B83B0